jgi:hypothetical protein
VTLAAKISSVTNLGIVTVIFNDDIYPIQNFTKQEYFNDTILQFKIKPSPDCPDPSLLAFNWSCTAFTEREMKFVLKFENPREVSSVVRHLLLSFLGPRPLGHPVPHP